MSNTLTESQTGSRGREAVEVRVTGGDTGWDDSDETTMEENAYMKYQRH